MSKLEAERAADHFLQKPKDIAIESKKFIEYRKIVSNLKVTITEGLIHSKGEDGDADDAADRDDGAVGAVSFSLSTLYHPNDPSEGARGSLVAISALFDSPRHPTSRLAGAAKCMHFAGWRLLGWVGAFGTAYLQAAWLSAGGLIYFSLASPCHSNASQWAQPWVGHTLRVAGYLVAARFFRVRWMCRNLV